MAARTIPSSHGDGTVHSDDENEHQVDREGSEYVKDIGNGSSRRNFQSRFTEQSAGSATSAKIRSTLIQQVVGHPLFFGRSLIQMGYEPLPPVQGRTLFGKEAMFYPNMFKYLMHIKSVDGFLGLYRGFGCALTAKLVSWYTTTQVEKLNEVTELNEKKDSSALTLNKTIKKTLQEVRCQSYGVLLSQPFYVMTMRCLGQFIGGETNYSSYNLVQNITEIYRQEGIAGFFSGLIPRWLSDVIAIVVTNFLIHLLQTQVSAQGEITSLYEYMASLSAQTLNYPFNVVSTVMAVNTSGLKAGSLVGIRAFGNWQNAYDHLAKYEQLKRGASLFNRMVTTGR